MFKHAVKNAEFLSFRKYILTYLGRIIYSFRLEVTTSTFGMVIRFDTCDALFKANTTFLSLASALLTPILSFSPSLTSFFLPFFGLLLDVSGLCLKAALM